MFEKCQIHVGDDRLENKKSKPRKKSIHIQIIQNNVVGEKDEKKEKKKDSKCRVFRWSYI